jgi:NADPH-dependent 2,4-dienoyl-CoA reductase/sulfur reductase-like enzyme
MSSGGERGSASATAREKSSAARSDRSKQRALDRLRRSGAQVLGGRTVFDVDASGIVQALCESASGSIVEVFGFDQLILATGARERFLPFPGWTLPGVFGVGGLQALVKGGFPVAGKRVVVAGTGPLLLAVAAHLAEDGARVISVVEQAPLMKLLPFAVSLSMAPAKLRQGAGYRARLWQSSYRTGSWVAEAIGRDDSQGLRAVRITDGRRSWEEPCDLLACGYHLVANTEIGQLLGCSLRGGFVEVDETQRTSLADVYCAGEPTGIAGIDAALVQGEIAGLACAGHSNAHLAKRAAKERAFGDGLESAFALRDELRSLPRPETIVCRCEDVGFASLSGRTGWTDTKLQTRCGMGPCQGRICGPAVEFLFGWKPVSVRQPIFPVPMQALCSESERQALAATE